MVIFKLNTVYRNLKGEIKNSSIVYLKSDNIAYLVELGDITNIINKNNVDNQDYITVKTEDAKNIINMLGAKDGFDDLTIKEIDGAISKS